MVFVTLEICVLGLSSELHRIALDGLADSRKRPGCAVVVFEGITMVSANVGSKTAGVTSKLLVGGGMCC